MKHMAYIPGEKIWVKHECFFLWNHRQDVFTIEIVRWIFSNLKSEVDLRKRPVLVEAAEKNRILYTRMLKGQNISGWFNLKSFPPKECKTFDKKNAQKKQKTETPLNVFENTTSIGGEGWFFLIILTPRIPTVPAVIYSHPLHSCSSPIHGWHYRVSGYLRSS